MSDFDFDLADRMRKALRVSGLGVAEIADEIEVSRNTVSAWINGKHEPRPRDLRAFARLTGASADWLMHGDLALAS